MGFDIAAINFLLYARKEGVNFKKTLMIGRQNYHIDKSDLKRCFVKNGLDAKRVSALLQADPDYVEPFLEMLGAETVHSIDASDYEKATLIYDLNQPIPAVLHQQYDVVVDAGTFEHIFNFPQAISNAMKMVKPGGVLISITPANNFFGHGFYQFSPELFYRVLSPENGFQIERLFLTAARPFATWYDVPDPRDVHNRVTLENACPVYLMIRAKKVLEQPLFVRMPLQSDYELMAWQDKRIAKHGIVRKTLLTLPPFIRKLASRSKRIATLKWLRTIFLDSGSGKRKYFRKVV